MLAAALANIHKGLLTLTFLLRHVSHAPREGTRLPAFPGSADEPEAVASSIFASSNNPSGPGRSRSRQHLRISQKFRRWMRYSSSAATPEPMQRPETREESPSGEWLAELAAPKFLQEAWRSPANATRSTASGVCAIGGGLPAGCYECRAGAGGHIRRPACLGFANLL